MALIALAIVLGYLLGSIPSAYIIGRVWGKIDLTREGDSHVSATAVYRKLGRIPFLVNIIMDVGKGALAVYLAARLSGSAPVVAAAAYAAVIGHCWSVFIRFRGGLGATVIFGVLAAMAFRQFLIAGALALILTFIIRKSSIATYALIVMVSIILLIQRKDLLPGLFPLGLILIQLLKRFLTKRTGEPDGYRNELFDDLKKMK